MDISTLSALIIEKIKEAGGYSELSDEALFKSIYGSLNMIYKKHFYIAQQKLESEERQGIFPNKERYKKEYEKVEDYVMAYANKLAATTKEQA